MKYFAFFILLSLICLNVAAQSLLSKIAEAETHLAHDNWTLAIKEFESILESNLNELSNLEKAKIYNALGYLNMRLLNAEQADYYLNLSVITHEQTKDNDQLAYANTLQNLSQFFLQRVQYDLSKNYIDQAIEIIASTKGKDCSEYSIARTKLAQIYEEIGYYDLAYEIYFESHEMLKRLGAFSPDYAEACNHMGRILIRKGEPDQAEEYFNESAVIYQQLGSDYALEHAESLEGMGNFYEQLGRYEEAEKILIEALEIKRGIPNKTDILIVETLNDLGILYRHLGDVERAEIMFKEVVKECEEKLSTEHPFYATAKNNLATIAMKNENFSEAKSLLEEALALYDKKYGPDHPLSSNTLNNLARVERQLKNTEVAEKYYKRVLVLDEQLYGKMHPDYATTLINLAILYSSSGNPTDAKTYYEQGLAIRKEVLGKHHPAYLSALENMGLQEMANNNFNDAERYFGEAIEIQIEQIATIFSVLNEKAQEAFYRRIREDIQRYNFIATELLASKPELVKRIFDFHIKTKSILFFPKEKVEQRILNGSDQGLRNLYFEWKDEKSLLANYYRMGVQRLLENNIDIFQIEKSILQTEWNLSLRMDEFETIIPEIETGWSDVQSQTGDDVIVQIIKIKEFKSQTNDDGIVFGFTNFCKYLAIIFSNENESPTYAIIGDRMKSDKEHYIDYLRMLKSKDPTNKAFSNLWNPIHEKVGKANKVKLCPEGIYQKINPNAFKINDDLFVIDQYFVSHLTSCKDIFRPSIPALTKKSLFFGNPDYKVGATNNNLGITSIPSAELEIESLAALLKPKNWETKTYSKQDASELRLRSAYNPTILHISTHGFFADNEDFISSINTYSNTQFKSGLYFSGASKTFSSFIEGKRSSSLNDGILTAHEAMSLDLNRTKLIVLSSCDTELEKVGNNESVYGLYRSLTVAGASNIVTSISKTQENAQNELMVLFYHKFMESENVSESLRFAQMKIRTKFEDPSIWGSFVLIGNG